MKNLLKLIDIVLIGIYFFFGGILISHLINRITIRYSDISKKELCKFSTLKVFYHLCKEVI